MSKFIKIAIFILIVAVLAFGGITLLKKRKAQLANLPTPERPVYVVKGALVKKGHVTVKRDFIGKIEPDNIVLVSTKYPGYIKKLYVSENSKVKKGDLIAVIDDFPVKKEIENLSLSIGSLKTQVEALYSQKGALKIALQTAKNIYLRNEKLYKKKAIPKEKLEISYSNFKKTEAQYKQTIAKIQELQAKISQLKNQIQVKKDQLSYLVIKSPVNGVVSKVFVKEGNIAFKGKPVVSIETNKNYKLLVSFPSKTSVKAGTPVVVHLISKDILSSVKKVYPSADKNSLYTAEIRLKELPEGIKSNSLINVSFILEKKEGLLVPKNAILNLTGKTYILTVKDNQFVKIPVKIVAIDEKNALIEGNVSEGTPVAVAEESKLRLLALGKKGKLILGNQR